MTATFMLTDEQITALSPMFGMRGSHVIVAAVSPAGPGWKLTIHALPGERRDSIRAACKGELKLSKRKAKTTSAPKA